jgi:hypothetical protein
MSGRDSGGAWTLLTGHGHVLVEIARDPRTRVGRRTHYTVNPDKPFRHRAEGGLRVGPLLDQLTAMADAAPPGPQAAQHQRPGGSRGS